MSKINSRPDGSANEHEHHRQIQQGNIPLARCPRIVHGDRASPIFFLSASLAHLLTQPRSAIYVPIRWSNSGPFSSFSICFASPRIIPIFGDVASFFLFFFGSVIRIHSNYFSEIKIPIIGPKCFFIIRRI